MQRPFCVHSLLSFGSPIVVVSCVLVHSLPYEVLGAGFTDSQFVHIYTIFQLFVLCLACGLTSPWCVVRLLTSPAWPPVSACAGSPPSSLHSTVPFLQVWLGQAAVFQLWCRPSCFNDTDGLLQRLFGNIVFHLCSQVSMQHPLLSSHFSVSGLPIFFKLLVPLVISFSNYFEVVQSALSSLFFFQTELTIFLLDIQTSKTWTIVWYTLHGTGLARVFKTRAVLQDFFDCFWQTQTCCDTFGTGFWCNLFP